MTSSPTTQGSAPGKIRILYAGAESIAFVQHALEPMGSRIALTTAKTIAEFQRISTDDDFDIFLTDLDPANGLAGQILEHVKKHSLLIPVIVVALNGNELAAVAVMQRGAADYVPATPEHREHFLRSVEDIVARPRSSDSRGNGVEPQLLAERNLLRTLIDNAPDYIYIKDCHGRFLVNNLPNTRLLGAKSEADVIGKTVYDFFPDEIARLYEADDRNVIESGKPVFDREEPFVTDGGLRGWFRTTKLPLRSGDGTIIGLLGITRDISERRQTQEELVRLVAAVDQSAESILILDTGGHVQYANPAFERVTGIPRGEIGGKHFDYLQELAKAPFTFAEATRQVDRTGTWTGHCTCRRPDDSKYELELTLSPIISARKERINYLLVAQDITRQSALEEQVRLSQKMEAIGLLAGGVAHDFNNILQVIQGFTTLAMEGLPTTDERHSYLEQVKQSSDRATQLTRQLLAFGRRQPLLKSDLDLRQLVGDLLKLVRRLIGEHIHVDYVPSELLANINADKSQMEQVVLNLCVNARDAMSEGGRLSIRLQNVTLDEAFRDENPWAVPGDYVRLTVTDTGCGMTKETLDRIFEPFFTTKTKEKGTGLGLSVVYGIVNQHDGLIHVESEPARGTRFDVYLPATKRKPEKSGTTRFLIKPHHGSETVLVAEDEAPVRELATRILERAGYRVISAINGEEACILFQQNASSIDMVILDVVMPRMGGREAYNRIAALRPGIPVLFCSGYSGTTLQGFDFTDAVQLLQKPYNVSELLTKVRDILDQAKQKRVEPA